MKIKDIFAFVAAFAVMVLVFFTASVLVCCIPHSLTDDNMRRSMEILEREGRFPTMFGNVLWAKDNITDGLMYNIAVSGYGLNPIDEAVTNLNSTEQGYDKIHSATYGLMALDTQNGSIERRSYGRYWHGYQVPLRVLSIGLTIKGIRILNCIVMWSLLLLSGWCLWRKCGIRVAAGWLVALFLAGFIVVPMSMQYVACFFITFIAVISFCQEPMLSKKALSFFVIGGFTAYADFLTAPLITLCLPLAVSIMINPDSNFRRLFSSIASWGGGYTGIWATKWLLLTLLSAQNGFSAAVGAGIHYFIIAFLPDGVAHKYFSITCIFLGFALITTIIIYVIKKPATNRNSLLFIVALIPFLWSILFLGHNVMHIFFTYRNLAATAFCCWLILFSKNKVHENCCSDTML